VQIGLTGTREQTLWPQATRAYSESWHQGKITLRVSMQLALPLADRTVEDLTKWAWVQASDIAIAVNRLGWRFAPHCQRQSGHEFQRR
jgi:hypothetical protein